MKRVLFVVDSYFQFINASNMNASVFSDCQVDVMITSSTPNAEMLFQNAKKYQYFHKMYYANSILNVGSHSKPWKKMLKNCVFIFTRMCPGLCLKRIIRATLGTYDELVFNGTRPIIECVYNVCRRKNPNIICSRMEDGHSSYFEEYVVVKSKLQRIIEAVFGKIFGTWSLEKHINGYYLMEPDLVQIQLDYPVTHIPKFNRTDTKLIQFLNTVFAYHPEEYSYDNKCIFFEDGRMMTLKGNEEVDIVKELVDVYGKENVSVKMHPRRTENRYAALGVTIAKASTVPWELIQLNQDFTNYIFVSVASSAPISSALYFEDVTFKILAFKCLKVPTPMETNSFLSYLSQFNFDYANAKFLIPKSYSDMKETLLQLQNKM